jgi:SAM-dependent methyltransferase
MTSEIVDAFDPAASFGEDVAATYDERTRRGDEVQAVAFLAALAGTGRALELGVGTGRIALPLAAGGVHVDGIDISPAMIARLQSKPGGEAVGVTIGDFADLPVHGLYRLVFVVFNTLFNLLTQDDQVRCFGNVARHLTGDGSFVVEAFVPTFLHRLHDDQYVAAEAIGVEEVRLDVARHDPITQRLDESHVTLTADGVRIEPIVTRYAWPSELDLMARLAGLALRERWGGWDRRPFTSTSRAHVSVYGR